MPSERVARAVPRTGLLVYRAARPVANEPPHALKKITAVPATASAVPTTARQVIRSLNTK